MKNIKMTKSKEQKNILDEALNSSENEQLDLYKAVFGGKGVSCTSITISRARERASAYDKTGDDQFLLAVE